jgi:ProQ/FINO family
MGFMRFVRSVRLFPLSLGGRLRDGSVSVEVNSKTKRLQDTTVMAVIALLAELYPKCFSVYQWRRRPLKLKIHLDIQAALDGAITPAQLHRALGISIARTQST